MVETEQMTSDFVKPRSGQSRANDLSRVKDLTEIVFEINRIRKDRILLYPDQGPVCMCVRWGMGGQGETAQGKTRTFAGRQREELQAATLSTSQQQAQAISHIMQVNMSKNE